MSSARAGWFVVMLSVAFAVNAQGQTAPTKVVRPSEIVKFADELGQGSRWYQLQWPMLGKPLVFSWNLTASPTYETLRWSTYDWNTMLAQTGPISLQVFNRVLPAIELDCLSGVCQPMVERTLGIEGRLNLGGNSITPNNYLFARPEAVMNPIRNYQRLKLGLGGGF
jgi:hypothetical protein